MATLGAYRLLATQEDGNREESPLSKEEEAWMTIDLFPQG